MPSNNFRRRKHVCQLLASIMWTWLLGFLLTPSIAFVCTNRGARLVLPSRQSTTFLPGNAKVQRHVFPETPDGSSANINDHRYSASDWLHNIFSIRRSTILRDIRAPVSTLFCWSVIVSIIHKLLKAYAPSVAPRMCIPSTPHSLLVSALGLLLVFRTNSAYQRFNEGRKIWEQILSVSRNLSRLSFLYEEDVTPKRKQRVSRLLGAFPYLLFHHIQESEGLSEIDEEKVPWNLFPPKARAKLLSSDNFPMWVADRLAQEYADIPYNPNFSARERFTFLSHVDKLSKSVGECERIHQTAVPQNYARHSLRSLGIWMSTLPFALVNDLGLLTGPVMGVIAWLLFGVYQIGASIEDPFQGSLRLKKFCDAVYADVMFGDDNGNPRESAFDLDLSESKQWDSLSSVVDDPAKEAVDLNGLPKSQPSGMMP